jgi:hypothetical protein
MRGGRRALSWALLTSAGEEGVYHNEVRMLLLLLPPLDGVVVSRRVSCWIVDWPSDVWPVTMRRGVGSGWWVLLLVVVDEGTPDIVAEALWAMNRANQDM